MAFKKFVCEICGQAGAAAHRHMMAIPEADMIAFLRSRFGRRQEAGWVITCSGVDTDAGTEGQWRRLIHDGLAEPNHSTLRRLSGPLGHRFSIAITAKGRQAVAAGTLPA